MISVVWLQKRLGVELLGLIKYLHIFNLKFDKVWNKIFILLVKEISCVSDHIFNKPGYEDLLIVSNKVDHFELIVKM